MSTDQSFSDTNQNNELDSSLSQNDLLNLLTNTIRQIRSKQSELEILQTSVEIVHQVLECDRVVVYSLLCESQGKIIAEALTPGFSPTLGSLIKDPCFEARHIDLYQRGRVKATSNIYEAGMSSCYLENLEQIEVKANLVIPLISNDGCLFGLMVMHQCRDFRQWQQSEINFGIQVAGWTMEQVGKAKKVDNLQAQLTETRQWQKALINLINRFNYATNQSEVLQIAVEEAQEFLQCDRAIIYSLETPNTGKIVAESSIQALAPIVGTVIQDSCFESGLKAQYQEGRVKVINNIYEVEMADCYLKNLEKIAVKASLIVPINIPHQGIYGLLVVHQCFAFREWQDPELEWLKEIGIQIGAALLRTNYAANMTALEASFNRLDNSKDSVTLAKDRIAALCQSIQDSMTIFSDLNNLQNLLLREIHSISNTKETKVMQIIMKKIALNIQKVKQSLSLFQTDTNQIEEILEDAATSLYGIEFEE